ncbi:lipopolysaccharide biosynthesis protein [Vibrio astriarenae]
MLNIKKAIYYLASDVFNKAIPFLLLPYIINSVSQDEYGLYALGVLFLQFSMAFCNSGISAKIIIDITTEGDWKSTIRSSYLLMIANVIILLAAIFVLNFLFWSDVNLGTLIVIVVNGALQSILIVNSSYYQANQSVIKYAILQIIHTLGFSIALVYSVECFTISGFWNVLLIFNMVYFCFQLLISHRIGAFSHKIKMLKHVENFKFAIFQLPHVMSNWVRLGYDRFILASGFSAAVVGGYSAVLQIAMILSVVLLAFNKFWTPYFFRNHIKINESKKYIFLISMAMLMISSLVCAGGYMIAIYSFPYSYREYLVFLPVVCLGFYFQGLYFLFVNYIHLYKKSEYISLCSIVSIAVYIIITPLMMKKYGIMGLSISLMISWLLLLVITIFIVNKIKKRACGRNEHSIT